MMGKSPVVHSRAISTILVSSLLTVVMSVALLIVMSQLGMIAFTGAGWMVRSMNLVSGYLGYSIPFFISGLIGYGSYFALLKRSLLRLPSDPGQGENIRFYNAGLEIFITLFFAVGVLFTAWGLQNALVSALGGVTQEEAGRLGAWGILGRLVDNGILIALWTTIVGGGGGYIMRILKFLYMGRDLCRFSEMQRKDEQKALLEVFGAIERKLEMINENTARQAERQNHVIR